MTSRYLVDLLARPGRSRGPSRRCARSATAAGAIAIATTLVGCGFVNTEDEDSDDGAGSLSVFLNTEQSSGLESIIAAFEDSSGVEVDVSSATTDDLNQQLRVQLTSGTAADVFRVSPGRSSPVAAGVLGADGELADVSDAAWVDDLSEDTRTLAGADGEIMAFPVGRNAIVMAYNRQVLADAGVEAPNTWSDLVAACATLRSAGVTPIANPLQGGVYLQFWMYALAATLVYPENPDIDTEMAAGKTSFAEDESWNEVFEKFLELRDADCFTEGALGVPPDQGLQAVGTGESAMILTVSPALPQLHDYAEGGADEISIFALPATDDAEDTHVPVAPDFIAVNAASDNVDVARDLLEFLAEPENVATYANRQSVLPGLNIDVDIDSESLDPVLPLIEQGRTAAFANYLWPNGDVQQTLLQSGQQLYDGSITTTELLAQMDAEFGKGTP